MERGSLWSPETLSIRRPRGLSRPSPTLSPERSLDSGPPAFQRQPGLLTPHSSSTHLGEPHGLRTRDQAAGPDVAKERPPDVTECLTRTPELQHGCRVLCEGSSAPRGPARIQAPILLSVFGV